jgi:hypothetical protein
MDSIFTHESFAECGCCACSLGYLDAEGKGGLYARTGYEAFDSSGALYRTVASRGWGGLNAALEGPIYNDAVCGMDRVFTLPPAPMTYYGTMLSQLWNLGAYPWGDTVFPPNTPTTEVTDCADGLIDFASTSYPEPDYHLAEEMDGEHDPLGPQGVTYLANLITADIAFLELRDYVKSLAWPGTYTRCWDNAVTPMSCTAGAVVIRYHAEHPTNADYITYEAARYRRRFPIPAAGTVQYEWDIYWTPEGGAAELYDTISWQWDEDTPVGYDQADPDTWPAMPWYEMPAYDSDLGYGTFSIAPADWRVTCKTADTATAPDGASIEVESA